LQWAQKRLQNCSPYLY